MKKFGGEIIEVLIKGYLLEISNNKKDIIETIGKRNKNIIFYKEKDTIYTIKILDNKIELIRKNDEFYSKMIFIKNEETNNEYVLNQINKKLYINLITYNLIVENNKILINYEIIDTKEKYEYKIELSDKI